MNNFIYLTEDKWQPQLQDIITSIYEGNGRQAVEILQVLEQAAIRRGTDRIIRYNETARDLQAKVLELRSTVFSADDLEVMMQEMAESRSWYELASVVFNWSEKALVKLGAF